MSPPEPLLATRSDVVAIGDGISAGRSAWRFSGETPKHFSTHVLRSIPGYEDGHSLIEQVSDYFIRSDSIAYELGTSTGTLLRKLAARHGESSRWIGLDIESDMIEQAVSEHGDDMRKHNVEYVVADACDYSYEPSDFFVSYYTLQFVAPRRRQALVDTVYKSLNKGGAFVLFEKVHAPCARFQDIANMLYVDFKLRNGYRTDEIIAKTHSLKGVLEPFSTAANLDMLRSSGFADVMTIYKYVCFEGFVAIK